MAKREEKIEIKGIKQLLPEIRENIFLKNYTTLNIGGPARFFLDVRNNQDLIRAIDVAKKLNLPFFILGGGSNLLVSDKGYNGLIIQLKTLNQNRVRFRTTPYRSEASGTGAKNPVKEAWSPTGGFTPHKPPFDSLLLAQGKQTTTIVADAATPLALLVQKSIKNGLAGLEWAVGIPGTVGGAIFGNSGAFSQSMADIVKTVFVLDINDEKLKIKKVKNPDCHFNYKDSIFKHNQNLIIVSCELKLKKGDKKEILKKIKEYLAYRKQRQPLDFPSAGSIFKNFIPRRNEKKLFENFPEFKEKKEIPAGFLIEKSGLKGKKCGDAQISEKHANFIINLGKARAEDVIKLIRLSKKIIKKKFKINLQEEIQYLGF